MCFLYGIFSLYRMCSLARAQTLVASKWPRVDDFTTHFTTHFNTQFTTYFTTQRGNDVHGFTRYTDYTPYYTDFTTYLIALTFTHFTTQRRNDVRGATRGVAISDQTRHCRPPWPGRSQKKQHVFSL